MDETTTTPETEVATGITEDQAASELLKRWGANDDKPEPKGKSETPEASAESDEPQDDAEDQPEGDGAADDQPDEPEEEGSGEVEIDVAGEKFKLPAKLKEHAERIQAKAKEVEAGATRKFQEAADLRKAVEARAEQVEHLKKIAHSQADLLADHRFVMRRLAQYEQLDVNRLAQEDPQALTRINAEYNQLRSAKERIEASYQQATQAYEAEQGKAKSERLKALDEFASKTVKDWTTDKGKRLRDYALRVGMDADELQTRLSPEFIKILDDAEFGAKVRNASPQKKAEPQKTLKPGTAASPKSAPAAKAQIALDRSRKTGKIEDAAMALLARASTRRK